MSSSTSQAVAEYTVRPNFFSSKFSVFFSGLRQPLAQFDDMETAERYAVQIAESSNANWKVDVYDGHGDLAATYNSEDDKMPKP